MLQIIKILLQLKKFWAFVIYISAYLFLNATLLYRFLIDWIMTEKQIIDLNLNFITQQFAKGVLRLVSGPNGEKEHKHNIVTFAREFFNVPSNKPKNFRDKWNALIKKVRDKWAKFVENVTYGWMIIEAIFGITERILCLFPWQLYALLFAIIVWWIKRH